MKEVLYLFYEWLAWRKEGLETSFSKKRSIENDDILDERRIIKMTYYAIWFNEYSKNFP